MPIDTTLANRREALARVSRVLDQLGSQYGLQREMLTDLRVALDEILSNIIDYAYADNAQHDITIHFEVRDGRLETVVEDDGIAFDPLSAPRPVLDSPLASRRVGGLGVHFVRNLMDEVKYERVGGRNRLTLHQNLGGATEGA
jgi:anti-sigma regulatory factor (Ser/Thr protein kinase)